MIDIPPALARNVEVAWGADGRAWLARLPELLDEIAAAWRLRLGEPYELSFHWVTGVRRSDGSAAVLKLGLPGAEHLRREAAALAAFDGHGAVRLLDHDADRGALLLELAEPGTLARALVPHDDDAATAVAVDVLLRLHIAPVPAHGLPDLHTERQAFVRHLDLFPGDTPLPRQWVELALRLFDRLCATAGRRVVLHGDLHHDNILRGRDGWVAIDPHGWVGDPGFDVGPLLYNPDPDRADASLVALVPRRLELLVAGLDLPRERAVAWGFVAAMLSDVWNTEDGGDTTSRALDVARLLAPEAAALGW